MTPGGYGAGARVLAVLALGAGIVAVSDGLSARELRGPDVAVEATSSGITAEEILCPGAEFAGIAGVPDLSVTPRVVAAAAPAEALGADVRTAGGTLRLDAEPIGPATTPQRSATTATRAELLRQTASDPTPVRVSATGGLAPGVLAAQESDEASAEVTGLAEASCGRAGADAWLIGGGGAPGRQERLVLLNPGANPVTVDVEVFGHNGRVESSAAQGIVVQGRSRASVLLDAVAPEEDSPAYHVTTRGGFVASGLADYWIDGITPRGIESVAPLAAPATEQLIAGVPGKLPTTVRLLAPGEREAVVEIRLLTPDGPAALTGSRAVVRVPAGSTRDVEVTDVPAGLVAVQIRSDEPVAAAALTAPQKARDFGWSVAAAPLAGLSGAVYPAVADPRDRTRTLALVATGGAARVTVTSVRRGGAQVRSLSLESETTATVDLSTSDAVWVRTAGPGAVRAAVTVTGSTGRRFVLAVRPLTQARVSATSVGVAPLSPLD